MDADAVLAIAKAAGFVISVDELKKSQCGAGRTEISDEELEGVAGAQTGSWDFCCGAGCWTGTAGGWLGLCN